MAEVDKLLPQIRGLVDPKAEQQIYDCFQRVYEFFDRKIAILEAANKKLLDQQAANFQQTQSLVNGIFATPLIGGSTTNPLTQIGVGDGTVKDVTAGSGLNGGTITQTGTISLIIGSLNVIQKSNGAQLMDSLATDDGSIFSIANAFIVDVTQSLIFIDPTFLPAADPGIPNALWNNAGRVSVSP